VIDWPPTPPTPISMDEIRCSLHDIPLEKVIALAKDDGCGCLVWTGYALEGSPQVRIDHRLWPVRRLIWELVHGPIRRGHQVGIGCIEPLCIHPDHIVSRGRGSVQRGKPLPADRKLRISNTKRAASKLDLQTVREIRASDLPNSEIDAMLGMSAGYASRIRTGRVWRDAASPFAGLGARS